MNYFKFHIGDYAKKCGRLSMLEHGAYTQLIQACYDRERFPTLDEAIDWIWARSDEEIAAVKFVLGRFFTFEDGVYVQSRIKEEIDAYNAVCAKNAEIATEREAKRKNNKRDVHEACTERAPSVHDESTNRHLTTNHKPLTINQEPKRERAAAPEKKPSRATRFVTESPPPENWISFCTAERPDLNPAAVYAKFADFWIAKPGKDGVKADWLATWRNWVRSEGVGRSPPARATPPSSHSGFESRDYAAGIDPVTGSF